jgi:hypothetical protein
MRKSSLFSRMTTFERESSGRFDPVPSVCRRPKQGVFCSLHETVVGFANAEPRRAKTARHLPDAGKTAAFDQ